MADDPDIDLSGIVVDFTNAGKLEERVLLICKAAYMAGKLINVDKVGNYLVDHGQTQATLRTCLRSLKYDKLRRLPREG